MYNISNSVCNPPYVLSACARPAAGGAAARAAQQGQRRRWRHVWLAGCYLASSLTHCNWVLLVPRFFLNEMILLILFCFYTNTGGSFSRAVPYWSI